MYTFLGLLPPDGILAGTEFTLVQLLRSPILAAFLHGTPAEDVSQTAAWYKEWNYGTFADSQRTPFGWAAITLGIGPHSSSC